ncbi:flavodoxin domain-containing protein [Brevibacterium otitidis]|uniref:Flavodoxin domain-containing protein n=1 Tax=Brevibacterium otitidis TaxID=53364 RepID=A0ABV5X113_9MICO|nr:hypothetical protein GCM10023233_29240 [Brevibacterium otitidis]
MSKGIVVYRSKYGAAESYAGWLAEAVGFDLADVKKANPRTLSGCDTIVHCGAVYATGISGLRFLRTALEHARDARAATLAVGASPPSDEGCDALRERNLTGPLAELPLFYARGTWDLSRMSFIDRTLCRTCCARWRRRIRPTASRGRTRSPVPVTKTATGPTPMRSFRSSTGWKPAKPEQIRQS